MSARGIGEVAQPFLEELSRRTQLSAYLAVLDGGDVVYTAHVPAQASLVSSLRVGARQKAWSTSSGRVLIAAMDDAALDRFISRFLPGTETLKPAELRRQIAQDRETGLVHKRSDFDPHMASCAAAVRGAGGEVIAAITAIGPASLVLDPAVEGRLQSEVTSSAETLSAALGARAD